MTTGNDATHHDPTGSPTGSRPAGRGRRRLLAGLLVLLVAGLACFAWVATTRSVPAVGISGAAAERQAERAAVMRRAEQFFLRVGTYGPEMLAEDGTMPEYRERVTEVITERFAVSFEKQATVAEQLVAKAGQSREAEVFASGVAELDDASATVLVAGSFTDSYGKGEPQAPSGFRIEVELQRVDGRWLVDGFGSVLDEESGQAPAPGGKDPGGKDPDGKDPGSKEQQP